MGLLGKPQDSPQVTMACCVFPAVELLPVETRRAPGSPVWSPQRNPTSRALGTLEPNRNGWSWSCDVLLMIHGCIIIIGVSLMFHCSRHLFRSVCMWNVDDYNGDYEVCLEESLSQNVSMHRCYCCTHIGAPVSYAQKACVSTSEIHYKRPLLKLSKSLFIYVII